jgi:predicted CxxxxCH...CXXCH cytochrome family protein
MTSPASGPITPFTAGDFANPFKTYTGARPALRYQTSHKWNGSDNVPQAGAQPPLSPALNTAYQADAGAIGNLACIRCHDPHNWSGASSPSNRLLRVDNSNDGLCTDCHRSRNSNTHLGGSHPVGITYATSVGVGTTITPPNPSNTNPLSTPQLVNGKVQCSSCHSVHFADSNSNTFKSVSSARLGRFNTMSTSTGLILRASMRGGTATATNICTSCHVNKISHNGANQNVQCTDCHGGHVDVGDGTPNVFLIKRYMNISTANGAVRNKSVYFTNVTSSISVVCASCHQVPTTGIAPDGTPYPPQHGIGKNCTDCHQHNAGKGSFSGGCTTCHGYPPQANTVGGPTGKATASYTIDESTTKHLRHAGGGANYSIACTECHYNPINDPNNSAIRGSHNNGSSQDVFQAGSGSIGSLFGASPTYDSVGHTCSNVYCHSNGAPAGGTLVPRTTPNWVNGTATTCSSCHEASPTTNAHQAHISVGFNCPTCHYATTQNGTTITGKANHANGTKDIQLFSTTLTNINSGKGTISLCSTVYCHSNGRGVQAPPTWTSVTGKCGVCHGADNSLPITTGAHDAHLQKVYGPNLNAKGTPTLTAAPSCATCHTTFPGSHLNGSVQSPSNCTDQCHPNGTGSALWTNGTRIPDCLLCHGGTTQSYIGGKFAPTRVNFPVTGHGQFPVSTTDPTKITCTGCHDPSTPHIGVTGGASRLIGGASNNTVCANCHNNANIVATPARQNMPTHVMAKTPAEELNPSMLCATCHDTHGTPNAHMIRSEIAFINSTSWTVNFDGTNFVDLTTNRGLCQVCHTKTSHYRAGVQSGTQNTTTHFTSGCTTCHAHKGDTYAFKPKGNCDSCHGYPPAPRNVAVTFGRFNSWSSARFEDYSGGGGAHLVAAHISPTAKPSDGFANCGICHNNGNSHLMQTPINTNVSNVTVVVDPKYRFSNASLITYTGAKLVNPPNNKTGSCFNVSCHLQQSPKWSTEK